MEIFGLYDSTKYLLKIEKLGTLIINSPKISLNSQRSLLHELCESEHRGLQELSFTKFNLSDDLTFFNFLKFLQNQDSVVTLRLARCSMNNK